MVLLISEDRTMVLLLTAMIMREGIPRQHRIIEITNQVHRIQEERIIIRRERQLIRQKCNVMDVENMGTGNQIARNQHRVAEQVDSSSSSKILTDVDEDDQCSKEAIVAFQGKLTF